VRAPRSAHSPVPLAIGETLSVELGRLREACPEHAIRINQECRVHLGKELLKLAEMHQGFWPISTLHCFTEAESPSIGLEIAEVILFLRLDERGRAVGDGRAFGEAPFLLVPDALVEDVSGDREDDEKAREDGADSPRSPIS